MRSIDLQNIIEKYRGFHLLTMNVEALGLSCPVWLTLDGPTPYLVHVSAFPTVVCILLLTSAATNCCLPQQPFPRLKLSMNIVYGDAMTPQKWLMWLMHAWDW